MPTPLISIIVPCYNYGGYIAETLDSIRSQSFDHWECIIVDDGSTDNSKEVVANFVKEDARFIYIYQENKGLPGARNTGIKNAKGKFIQFLDSDDLLEKDKLKIQTDYLEKNEELDLVYSDLMYFNDGHLDKLLYSMDWLNAPWTLKKSGNGKKLLKYFIISTPILVPMPILKTSSVRSINGFVENLRSCEDWDFWFRCANENFKFQYLNLPKTRSLVRIHASSMTKNRSTMINSMIEVRGRFRTMLNDKKLIALNDKFLINNQIELAILKKQFENTADAKIFLKNENKKHKSLRIRLFTFTLSSASVKLNYTLLNIIKSMMKKYYYLVA